MSRKLTENSAPGPRAEETTLDPTPVPGAPDERPPMVIQMPVDVRSFGISVIAVVAVIWFIQSAQVFLIPFALSLLFYALDPFVDRLQAWKVPRVAGAALVLLTFGAAVALTALTLSGEVLR